MKKDLDDAVIHHVDAVLEGRWWRVSAPELDVVTQARSLKEVELMARDLIALTLDVSPDLVAIELSTILPDEICARLKEASRLQLAAEETASRASQLRRDAINSLVGEQRISQKDAARALGLSPQRVQQLVSAKRGVARESATTPRRKAARTPSSEK